MLTNAAGGFAAFVDGKQGLIRLEAVFSANTLTQVKEIQPDLDLALIVNDATFTWDANALSAPDASPTPDLPDVHEKEKRSINGTQQSQSAEGSDAAAANAAAIGSQDEKNTSDDVPVLSSAVATTSTPALSVSKSGHADGDNDNRLHNGVPNQMREEGLQPAVLTTPQPRSSETETAHVFEVRNVTMQIPRGQLVAIVGPVGSGKSSLLQGLVCAISFTSLSLILLIGSLYRWAR
jgi:ABC-type multidrug transport system fused ATPase/permease subunit